MMYLIQPCAPASGEDPWVHGYFFFTQAGRVLLPMYHLANTIISDLISLSGAVCYTLVAVMLVLMLSLLTIPLKMTLFPRRPKTNMQPSYSSDKLVLRKGEQMEPLLTPSSSATFLENMDEDASDIETLLAVGEGAVKKKGRPRRGDDFKFWEAFIKTDLWLFWLVYFLGVGSGITVLNNLAQIGVAFGLSDTTMLLALLGFCNFCGLLGSDAVSEHFVSLSPSLLGLFFRAFAEKSNYNSAGGNSMLIIDFPLYRTRMIPRTVLFTSAELIMVVTFIPFVLGVDGILYVSTALLGLSYGILYGTMAPTASELFGLQHFGIIFNFMMLGNPVGPLFSLAALPAMYMIRKLLCKEAQLVWVPIASS